MSHNDLIENSSFVVDLTYCFCQECLASKKLDTAASYLIILQNLEKIAMARQVRLGYLFIFGLFNDPHSNNLFLIKLSC
jgi:RIC1